MFPAGLGVAASSEVASPICARLPSSTCRASARAPASQFEPILAYYGLSRESIEAWGGRFLARRRSLRLTAHRHAPRARRRGRRYLENVYAAFTPEAAVFHEASILLNLRFLPFPDDLIQLICRDYGGEPCRSRTACCAAWIGRYPRYIGPGS